MEKSALTPIEGTESQWTDRDGNLYVGRTGQSLESFLAELDAGTPATPTLAPASISPLQARNGLRTWGIGRAQIDAFFSAIGDEAEREAAEDAWEYATQIDRSNRLVAACAAFLGKTEADVDQFFTDAAT
ncbi:hypothetical protein [Aurantimonas endophytica]|uniref:Uncharacterized protein n=1 Tax=Aurantimonas endophytica TaxID=1522175 RepID=A0A7W6MP79_9HYPH|nr:hypothetical protein [Aurantimonas endophytica]MBB4002644.1 hypothetical protein [Aurantimonas endophytica]MCO6403524.1 hypothetical protein [Aurantimonas endophytica]